MVQLKGRSPAWRWCGSGLSRGIVHGEGVSLPEHVGLGVTLTRSFLSRKASGILQHSRLAKNRGRHSHCSQKVLEFIRVHGV